MKTINIILSILLAVSLLSFSACKDAHDNCQFPGTDSEAGEKVCNDGPMYGLFIILASSPPHIPPAPPTYQISYPNSGTTLGAGSAISPFTVSYSNGTPQSFSINPALPGSLSLNTTTGEVSGTPSGTSSYTYYTVSSTSVEGESDSTSLNFGVASGEANVTCNTLGTAPGCSISYPYACPNSLFCYNTLSGCRNSTNCAWYL